MKYIVVLSLLLFTRTIYADSPWLAYGELRGNLQPCGCDPQTDLGGVRRLATLISREKSLAPDLLVFDLGNNFHQGPRFDLLSSFLSTALDELAPTAALLCPAELPYYQKYHARRPLVLSNRQKGKPLGGELGKDAGGIGQEVVRTKNAVILGYYWQPNFAQGLRAWGPELREHWKKLLAPHQHQERVLLFYGPRAELRQIAEAKLFTTLISGSDKPAEMVYDPAENSDSAHLRAYDGAEKKGIAPIYMVPLGGAGVLRGGSLRAQEAPSLEQMLAPNKKKEALPFAERLVSWLTKNYEDGSPLAPTLARYEKEAAAEFKSHEGARTAQLKDSKFIGAEACRGCHTKAYEQWQKSRHSHAYATLVQAGKGENATCVSCHVLALNEPGGFVSLKESPQFAHVQCETCHGPRKAHSSNPTAHKGIAGAARQACASCHNAVHSPKFQFDKYWSLIKH